MASPAPAEGRPPAEADDELRTIRLDRGQQELAEPAARCAQRIALLRRKQRQPDRLRRLHYRPPVREHEPARVDRAAERVRDPRRPPLAPPRPCDHLERALATVLDRHLLHLDPLDSAEAL